MAGERGSRGRGPGEDVADQRDGFRGFNGFSSVVTGQHSEEGHRSADS